MENWDAIREVCPYETGFDSPYDFYNLDESLQVHLVVWCLSQVKQKHFNYQAHSRSIKNIFENSRFGKYITNGQFKGAMLIAGFRVKDIHATNWNFNVKQSYLDMDKRYNEENYDEIQRYKCNVHRMCEK